MERLRYVGLCLWAVGAQMSEALCTAGAILLVASFLPNVRGLTRRAFTAWAPLWLFIGWALVAPTLAGHPPTGTGVARTLDWATLPLVALAAAQLTAARWRGLALVAFTTCALSCIAAGLQHFGLWPQESAFAPLAWTKLPFARVYEAIADTGRFMGGGLAFHRLKFAHVTGLAAVALTWLAARRETPRRPLVAALGLFAFVAVWVFPAARMGAVAMTVAVAVTLLLASPSKRRALGLALGLAAVAVLVLLAAPSARARFVTAFSAEGNGFRGQLLGAGLEAVRRHPVTGVGPGRFHPRDFGGPEMDVHVRQHPGKAHDQFVSMAAETGAVGGLLFVWLCVWLALRARRLERGALALGALAQFATLSLVHDPLFHATYSLALMLLVGLGLGATQTMTAETGVPAPLPHPGRSS